jgi:hypothetical protein
MTISDTNFQYSFPNPTQQIYPYTVVSNRSPLGVPFTGPIGQTWVWKNNSAYSYQGTQNGLSSISRLLGAPSPIIATLTTTDDTPTLIYTINMPSVVSSQGCLVNLTALSITGGGVLQVLEAFLLQSDGSISSKPSDSDLIYNSDGDMDDADFSIDVSGNSATLTVYGILATTIDWKVEITINQAT